jgi:hypothetical protein
VSCVLYRYILSSVLVCSLFNVYVFCVLYSYSVLYIGVCSVLYMFVLCCIMDCAVFNIGALSSVLVCSVFYIGVFCVVYWCVLSSKLVLCKILAFGVVPPHVCVMFCGVFCVLHAMSTHNTPLPVAGYRPGGPTSIPSSVKDLSSHHVW